MFLVPRCFKYSMYSTVFVVLIEILKALSTLDPNNFKNPNFLDLFFDQIVWEIRHKMTKLHTNFSTKLYQDNAIS